MLKRRIILVVISTALIVGLFLLPKVVVENESQLKAPDSASASNPNPHTQAAQDVQLAIARLRQEFLKSPSTEKNAIFADSLADLYREASRFDSAAWFAENAAAFFNTKESWLKAGDNYYQAYTFALDQLKQNELSAKAQECLTKVLTEDPHDLETKSKLAMTYLSSANPMQGITLLREVLSEDPKNETALFNLGMLSIQSGQYERAVERLNDLMAVNPSHVQGNLLLGIAYMNTGNKKLAREQFEKVKQLDKDPAVQATVDSYLKDLK
jgi:cytochrome c-type biogenesis protein CcmH/NrfG